MVDALFRRRLLSSSTPLTGRRGASSVKWHYRFALKGCVCGGVPSSRRHTAGCCRGYGMRPSISQRVSRHSSEINDPSHIKATRGPPHLSVRHIISFPNKLQSYRGVIRRTRPCPFCNLTWVGPSCSRALPHASAQDAAGPGTVPWQSRAVARRLSIPHEAI